MFFDFSTIPVDSFNNPILPAINAGGSQVIGGSPYTVSTNPPIATTPQTSGWMNVIQAGLALAADAYNKTLTPVAHPTTPAPATPTASTGLFTMENLPKILLGGAVLALGIAAVMHMRGR